MYLEIPQFLTAEECAELVAIAGAGTYADGLATAPGTPREVKHNEQLAPRAEDTARMKAVLLGAIGRAPALQLFTQAREVREPILSRYLPGMRYGRHLDAAILPRGTPMRTDLSMTVFLSDPDSYEGGALVLDTDFGAIECRLPAGAAVCYSTLLWHEVEPVTAGARLALVTWFQSRVRDPMQRGLLFDIGTVLAEVRAAAPGSAAAERLERAYGTMLRLWSEV